MNSTTTFRFDGSKKNFDVLDLFSGIGGFSLGLEAAGAFRTVAFCEREPFCQAVLQKHWPDTPIYDDVRTIDTDRLGRVDLICGGFPCQPWSAAGQQRGAEDDRDLWPVMASLVEDIRPRWVIGENVRGFVNEPLGLQRSLSDLESIGYSAVPFVIPACAVDAPHRRDRVWIIAAQNDADSDGERPHRAQFNKQREAEPADGQKRFAGQVRKVLARRGNAGQRDAADVANADRAGQPASEGCREDSRDKARHDAGRSGADVADADGQRGRGRDASRKNAGDVGQPPRHTRHHTGGVEPWLAEPDVGRVADGIRNRAHRLRALGNAVVPQIVTQIGRAIMQAEG